MNEKKRVLDQSNSKVWVQFVPNAGKKNPVAKGLSNVPLYFLQVFPIQISPLYVVVQSTKTKI